MIVHPPLWTFHLVEACDETCNWCDRLGEAVIRHILPPLSDEYACASCAAIWLRSQAYALDPNPDEGPIISRMFDLELQDYLGGSE